MSGICDMAASPNDMDFPRALREASDRDLAASIALWARLNDVKPPGTGLAEWLCEAFVPRAHPDDGTGMVTGYFEPEIPASAVENPDFPVPILSAPADAEGGSRLPARAEIEEGALAGRAKPLFWLADPVELFFLQVQGSGRLDLRDGRRVRVGYAARNGHPYTSIGQLLIREDHLPADRLTAQAVQSWLRADPARGRAMMRRNASYVFFRERAEICESDGPVGTIGVPLVAGLSVAVDPAFHPLGSLVWIERSSAPPRLTLAMDTGSAIRGAHRCDLFFGTGAEAGNHAGALAAPCRLTGLAMREHSA